MDQNEHSNNVTPIALKATERNAEEISDLTNVMMQAAVRILQLSQTRNIAGILANDQGVPTHVIEVRMLNPGEDPRKTWDFEKIHEVKRDPQKP